MRPAGQVDSGSPGWREWWLERGERELRCILMTAWDPIGVGDAPEAWDEYETYALEVARILRETMDPQEAAVRVAEYLDGVEQDSMELSSGQDRLHNARLAASLVAWHEWSYTRGGLP
jgi:hypothetical protein